MSLLKVLLEWQFVRLEMLHHPYKDSFFALFVSILSPADFPKTELNGIVAQCLANSASFPNGHNAK